MIGVDTNILVRYLTQDDAEQVRVVDGIIDDAVKNGERLYVDDVVACELVWVLRGAYRFDKATIASTLDKILTTALFSFEDRDLLRSALVRYREGNGDFADYVIGTRNERAGCDHTITFDRALGGSDGFSLLRTARR
ncbi:MAG TPA: type II toxin-antitoxin system VapC family toxin [Thermoanaerobaculia bacterium]|nr:type II toxin-antitoxin system VapC family toxin [Thermoanaerobaculia bacterium]